MGASLIAQTLHGYDQGHRLLSRGGDVDERELAILDRLSDLSGYLPVGTDFDSYYTGFPCGRYYAFARTWSDKGATRAGTVLTHTILVPLSSAVELDDLWALGSLHRRPTSAADRATYSAVIQADLTHLAREAPEPSLDPARAEATALLWFGQLDRPILWVADSRPDDVARHIWTLLWPEPRQSFAFCTFALQARLLQGRPFDWLGVPAAARGSFHERAGSSAWWQNGQIASAALREARTQPWVRALVEHGAPLTHAMTRYWREHDLPSLDAGELPLFFRFQELEPAAQVRLTAARARADLFTRLWPRVAADHPVQRSLLRDLLARQGDAPLEPRPLWELRDFLSRPSVQALYELDALFAKEVGDVLERELRHRLFLTNGSAPSELSKWFMVEPDVRVREALRKALRVIFAAKSERGMPEELMIILLEDAAKTGEEGLIEVVFQPEPAPRRASLFERAAEAADLAMRKALAHIASSISRRLVDPRLAALGGALAGEPLRGLLEATEIVLSQPLPSFSTLDPIVAAASPSDRLAWSLEIIEPALAPAAASVGAAAAIELRISGSDLLAQCREHPNGALVLFEWSIATPSYEVTAALRRAGPLASDLLKFALDRGGPSVVPMIAAITEALPDASIFSPEIASSVRKARNLDASHKLVELTLPRLVGMTAGKRWTPGSAAQWLSNPLVQRALELSPPNDLFFRAPGLPPRPNWLPNVAHAIRESLESESSKNTAWIPSLLVRPLGEANAESLSASEEDLLVLLRHPLGPRDREAVSVAVLEAMRRTGSRTARRLIELTFPVVYPKLLEKESLSWRALISRWATGWDVAKSWRHWLLDTWIDRSFPPDELLLCLGEDTELFRRIAHRASKTTEGRAFLQSMRRALERHVEPTTALRRAARRILDHPDRGTEDDE